MKIEKVGLKKYIQIYRKQEQWKSLKSTYKVIFYHVFFNKKGEVRGESVGYL